jgi:hypothetical protein
MNDNLWAEARLQVWVTPDGTIKYASDFARRCETAGVDIDQLLDAVSDGIYSSDRGSECIDWPSVEDSYRKRQREELDVTDDQGDADPGEPENEELGSPKFISNAEAAARRQDRG